MPIKFTGSYLSNALYVIIIWALIKRLIDFNAEVTRYSSTQIQPRIRKSKKFLKAVIFFYPVVSIYMTGGGDNTRDPIF